jgi:hypothetical protein
MNPGTSALKPDVATYPLPSPRPYSNSAPQSAILTSWKDIARYMGKGVRTVQRWEQDFGLPVRRPLGSNKKAVLARPLDLDAWVAQRCSSRAEPLSDPERVVLQREIAELRRQLALANERLQMILRAQAIGAVSVEATRPASPGIDPERRRDGVVLSFPGRNPSDESVASSAAQQPTAKRKPVPPMKKR